MSCCRWLRDGYATPRRSRERAPVSERGAAGDFLSAALGDPAAVPQPPGEPMTTTEPSTVVTLNVEAVLFDMDGTLVDSTRVVEDLWAQFAARYGVALSAILAYSHGRQTRDTVDRFLPAGNDAEKVVAEFHEAELERTKGITEIAGARRLLAALTGARIAVVTSAPRPLATRRLAAAGLEVPETLVSSDDIPAGKPDPAGYREAARLLGVAPSRCLAVEDAEAGICAAISAGAHTLVVGAHRSRTTQSLHRVPDLRAVTAIVSADGSKVQVRWPRGTA